MQSVSIFKEPNLLVATMNAASSEGIADYAMNPCVRSPSGMTVWQSADMRGQENTNCNAHDLKLLSVYF
jgi:hypothetical protein